MLHGGPLSRPFPCGMSADKEGYLVYGVVPVRFDYRVKNRRDAGLTPHTLVRDDNAPRSKKKIERKCRRAKGNRIRGSAS